ncbi:hypothetical protein PDESU_01179 [Pontiella desulfatans]|uniref:Uncharacterized protein n=1 Tax=Pontiella desulfatans TaxID=2750659 RepID=A0A6C2TZM8_PONDE|nr:hypothetical protein [Pontiella desulfatans]VGO12626.1 hypothetical protein PDESU_01179 [Pontiella desulfatans]
MKTILSIQNTYPARIIAADFVTEQGFTGKGSKIRPMKYRAFNYELELFNSAGESLGFLPAGFPAENITSHNSHFIKFIRQLGLFCYPHEFDPATLIDMQVQVVINNICNHHHGLRPYVIKLLPLTHHKKS